MERFSKYWFLFLAITMLLISTLNMIVAIIDLINGFSPSNNNTQWIWICLIGHYVFLNEYKNLCE